MPSRENITAPITLIAHGRSGTSVLHKVFESDPTIDAIGESANLIFGTWFAVEGCKGITRLDTTVSRFEQRCADAVQAAFLALFTSDKPRWMQKPIGLPSVRWNFHNQGRIAEFPEWYWRALRMPFPQGKFFTILRDPRDVVLSSMTFWNSKEERVWHDLGQMANLFMHKDSLVRYAVLYDELTSSPEAAINDMCEHLQINLQENAYKQTDSVHVPVPGTHKAKAGDYQERVERGYSRREQWARLNVAAVDPKVKKSLSALWERFGQRLTF